MAISVRQAFTSKRVRALALAVAALALPTSACLAATRVIDGDTIVVDGEHIRLANIDAPEIRHHKCESELALGVRAKLEMQILVETGTIVIVRGDHGRMKDRYGRSLGRVLVDGVDVGEVLIARGLARRWDGRRHPWCR